MGRCEWPKEKQTQQCFQSFPNYRQKKALVDWWFRNCTDNPQQQVCPKVNCLQTFAPLKWSCALQPLFIYRRWETKGGTRDFRQKQPAGMDWYSISPHLKQIRESVSFKINLMLRGKWEALAFCFNQSNFWELRRKFCLRIMTFFFKLQILVFFKLWI